MWREFGALRQTELRAAFHPPHGWKGERSPQHVRNAARNLFCIRLPVCLFIPRVAQPYYVSRPLLAFIPAMYKFLKITGILLGALVLLIGVAAVVLPLIVDPNDFKPRIEAAVEESTGRNLEIPGDIDLSVFPWIGVELGSARLGEAPGFGDQPFATFEGMQVRVKLLPLISRQVQVGKVVVEQPRIRLLRDADGRANWEDLTGETAEADTPTAEDQQDRLPEFSVDGIEIRNGYVLYRDAATGREVELSNFNLTAGQLGLPADFPLTATGHARLPQQELDLDVEFSGRVAADVATERFSTRDGRLKLTLRGKNLPASPLSLQSEWLLAGADLGEGTAELQKFVLSAVGVNVELDAQARSLSEAPRASGVLALSAADLAQTASELRPLVPEDMTLSGQARGKLAFAYDQAANKVEVGEFMLQALGLDTSGWLQAAELDTEPAIKGRLEVAEFSPGNLMVRLGQELPATRDGEVLDRASLAADIEASSNSVAFENLVLVLDESTLTGRFAVADLQRQALRFDLAMDAIDVDRYLPPADEQAAADAGAETPLNQVEVPAELVRGLDIEGKLIIGELKAFDFNSTEVRVGISARDDKLRLHPAEARFYGGGYRGDIRVDASAELPVISLNESVDRIRLAPLMKDVLDSERLSGTAEASIQAQARGRTIGELRQTLSGQFAIDISDGAIEGFNVWESIREAYAKLKGRGYDRGDAPKHTEFADLTANGRMQGGVVYNDNLKANLPFLRVSGKGSIDIAAETLDYVINARVMKAPELKDGIEELTGTEIPVRISGSLADPKVRPDVKAVLEQKAKEALQRNEQEVREKADEKIEREKERAREKLKDKLKGILG